MAENKQKTMANFLTSALGMEDEINNSVYKDYTDAKNWPKGLKPEAFESIRKHLDVLIKDTLRHREIILSLIKKYG